MELVFLFAAFKLFIELEHILKRGIAILFTEMKHERTVDIACAREGCFYAFTPGHHDVTTIIDYGSFKPRTSSRH